MAKILDGTALAGEIRGEVAAGVLEMQDKHRVTPGLAAILVGDDPGSAIYVRNKRRACDEAGMFSETFSLPGSTSQDQGPGRPDPPGRHTRCRHGPPQGHYRRHGQRGRRGH